MMGSFSHIFHKFCSSSVKIKRIHAVHCSLVNFIILWGFLVWVALAFLCLFYCFRKRESLALMHGWSIVSWVSSVARDFQGIFMKFGFWKTSSQAVQRWLLTLWGNFRLKREKNLLKKFWPEFFAIQRQLCSSCWNFMSRVFRIHQGKWRLKLVKCHLTSVKQKRREKLLHSSLVFWFLKVEHNIIKYARKIVFFWFSHFIS